MATQDTYKIHLNIYRVSIFPFSSPSSNPIVHAIFRVNVCIRLQHDDNIIKISNDDRKQFPSEFQDSVLSSFFQQFPVFFDQMEVCCSATDFFQGNNNSSDSSKSCNQQTETVREQYDIPSPKKFPLKIITHSPNIQKDLKQ